MESRKRGAVQPVRTRKRQWRIINEDHQHLFVEYDITGRARGGHLVTRIRRLFIVPMRIITDHRGALVFMIGVRIRNRGDIGRFLGANF